MKRLLVTTVLLLTALVLVTTAYFKNLNVPGHNASRILQTIPADAALIFEFSNDNSFFDVYDSSALFSSLISTQQLHELALLRQQLLQNAALKPFFNGQNMYLSVHPQGDLLFTLSTAKGFTLNTLQGALQARHIQSKQFKTGAYNAVQIQLPGAIHQFEVIDRGRQIYSGSFSSQLIAAITKQQNNRNTAAFTSLPDQQQNNALANLYINNLQLSPLLAVWFKNGSNTDFIKPLRLMPAKAALTLNYKTDAFIFNGYTGLDAGMPASYLTLFKNQQPYHNQLKNIFPAITAYSTCFSVSDPLLFQNDLVAWQNKAGLSRERKALFDRIKAETGVQLDRDFKKLLSNEFAVITTRFDEKLAIMQVKDGSALRPLFTNISIMDASGNSGRINYGRLPFFLLGDAFTGFRQPYFTILDNYLILANSAVALNNYVQIYNNRSFIASQRQYNEFDGLLAEQCNVASFISYKNAAYILKRDLKAEAYQTLYTRQTSMQRYYAASYQLSSSNKQFYTNLCMQLNKPDSASLK